MSDNPDPPVEYGSYLLRLRYTRRDGQPLCQVTLIHLPSQETHYFADLESLMAYLAEGAGKQPDRQC